MKRVVIILALVVFAGGLCSCNSNVSEREEPVNKETMEQSEKSNQQEQAENEPVQEQKGNKTEQFLDERVLVDTEYYTLEIPASWEDECFYEINEGENWNYTLAFYEKESYDAGCGGHLFSIKLFTEFEEYSYLPEYEVLGSLTVYRIGAYNVIITYPSDIQFSEKTVEKYSDISKEISSVLTSISFKEECSFSKEPLPIVIIEEPQPEISGAFIGRWIDLGWGSSAPGGASRWNVEFRENGTGTFEFVYEEDDIVRLDFEYSTYEYPLGEGFYGILVPVDGGTDLSYVIRYTWSNDMQTTLMTMYAVEDNGVTMNLDVFWVYAKE